MVHRPQADLGLEKRQVQNFKRIKMAGLIKTKYWYSFKAVFAFGRVHFAKTLETNFSDQHGKVLWCRYVQGSEILYMFTGNLETWGRCQAKKVRGPRKISMCRVRRRVSARKFASLYSNNTFSLDSLCFDSLLVHWKEFFCTKNIVSLNVWSTVIV